MKIFRKDNVFEAAIKRIHWLFDEFEHVVVSFSGGKDSTAVLNLTLRVAEERGRLPLKVLFLDQEAEWQTVSDYVRTVMDDPRVEPVWLQMPIRISNATSSTEQWLWCWEEGKEGEWMREKEPDSIHENTFGTVTFKEVFKAWARDTFGDDPMCFIAGVRTEESPARFVGLTAMPTYKGRTWGVKLNPKIPHVTMYPLYDWSYTDIWKAMHDEGWPYCGIYDAMYQYGVRVQDMRVSNVHHETAITALYFMQEVEPETWAKLTSRLEGISTVGQMQDDAFKIPKDLPPMFKTWQEYRDYLVENLIGDPKLRKKYTKKFIELDRKYGDMPRPERLFRAQINTVLANDYWFTKLNTIERSPQFNVFRKFKRGEKLSSYELGRYANLIK